MKAWWNNEVSYQWHCKQYEGGKEWTSLSLISMHLKCWVHDAALTVTKQLWLIRVCTCVHARVLIQSNTLLRSCIPMWIEVKMKICQILCEPYLTFAWAFISYHTWKNKCEISVSWFNGSDILCFLIVCPSQCMSAYGRKIVIAWTCNLFVIFLLSSP